MKMPDDSVLPQSMPYKLLLTEQKRFWNQKENVPKEAPTKQGRNK